MLKARIRALAPGSRFAHRRPNSRVTPIQPKGAEMAVFGPSTGAPQIRASRNGSIVAPDVSPSGPSSGMPLGSLHDERPAEALRWPRFLSLLFLEPDGIKLFLNIVRTQSGVRRAKQ